MVGYEWTLGLLVGAVFVHVLIAYRAYRLREGGAATGTVTDGEDVDAVDADEGTVACPNCGAANEPRYRFCRSCVTELPAAMDFERDGDGPYGRFVQ